ncbi:transcriptional regulator (plasmid) [Shigella boydii]|nr:Hha/YmoA family nucleoid-associated regulatory protein [Shigella boydii]QNC65910.1 transcriptional regulator [Shigella boydii]
MAKTKQEWLYQLRRCSSVNTLEKIIHKNRDSLSNSERESFNSAADHRLAELITGKLYDRIPKEMRCTGNSGHYHLFFFKAAI